MFDLTVNDRIQWSIQGHRFEFPALALLQESNLFKSYFEQYQGTEPMPDYTGAAGKSARDSPKVATLMHAVVEGGLASSHRLFRFTVTDVAGLDPEWMGAILVFLRRGRVNWEWTAMDREQKLGFSRLIHFFQLHKLQSDERYNVVADSADVITENDSTVGADPKAPRENGEASEASFAERLALAQVELEKYRDQQRTDETLAGGRSEDPAPAVRVNPPHPSIDDEGLEMHTTACGHCGSAGTHSSESCPHKK